MVNTREIAAEYRLSHWASVMQERNASGMNIRAYCESIGIHTNVYFYWQRKLREAACQELLSDKQNQSQSAIIPNGWAICDVADSAVKNDNSIIIEIGKFKVAVSHDNDIELLTKVCRVLMSLC